MLTNRSEERGLDYGYTFALINLAWAPGQTLGAAGGGARRTRDDGCRSLPAARRRSAALTLAASGGRMTLVTRVKTVLVANRGEIALRVFRAARARGLATVAVVAPDDRGIAARALGRRVVEIASYLDAAEHVRAAVETGADAVHPGYGFLAENADFAAAVDAAGLRWVGPPADALRAGGDKVEAKRIAREAGVPVVPGDATSRR